MVNLCCNVGFIFFYKVFVKGYDEIVKYLFEMGFDINLCDNKEVSYYICLLGEL